MHLNFAFWSTLVLATFAWIWQYSQLRQDIPNPIYAEIFRQNVGIGFLLLAGMIVGVSF